MENEFWILKRTSVVALNSVNTAITLARSSNFRPKKMKIKTNSLEKQFAQLSSSYLIL